MNAIKKFLKLFSLPEPDNFKSTFWCKNCGKESSLTFSVGTRIDRARLVGDGTGTIKIGDQYKKLVCPICKIGSLF